MKSLYLFGLLAMGVVVIIGLQGVNTHPGDFSQAHFDLPFVSQAPLEKWNEDLFQNACEEASMYMVKLWRDHALIPPSAVVAENALMQMVQYEQQYSIYKSMSLDHVQRLLRDVYHVDRSLSIDNPSVDMMKEYLRAGVFLVPASGAVLANPHFRRPFPAYHMMVLIGYNDTTGEFIVNDPGTKFGKDFRYPYATVMDAMHDWTGSRESILDGAKRVLYVPRQ